MGSVGLDSMKASQRQLLAFAVAFATTSTAAAEPQNLSQGLVQAAGNIVQDVVNRQNSGSVNTRLGLLATDLGLDPTASSGSNSNSSPQLSSDFTDASSNGNSFSGRQQQQCCCEPLGSTCDVAGPDLVGGGLIDARRTTRKPRIGTRIVNRPSASIPQKSLDSGMQREPTSGKKTVWN